jgi:hypothetical protein
MSAALWWELVACANAAARWLHDRSSLPSLLPIIVLVPGTLVAIFAAWLPDFSTEVVLATRRMWLHTPLAFSRRSAALTTDKAFDHLLRCLA